MFLPFLIFSVVSVSLVKLGALLVWVRLLSSLLALAVPVIGLLTASLIWQALRRRR